MEKLTTLKQVTDEIMNISQYLQERYNENEGNELMLRLTNLNIYLARSAEMVSKAQFFYDKAQGEKTEQVLLESRQEDLKLSPTVIKKLVDGKCYVESAALKYSERLNRAITHQIDSIRTQLSYVKETNKNSWFCCKR